MTVFISSSSFYEVVELKYVGKRKETHLLTPLHIFCKFLRQFLWVNKHETRSLPPPSREHTPLALPVMCCSGHSLWCMLVRTWPKRAEPILRGGGEKERTQRTSAPLETVRACLAAEELCSTTYRHLLRNNLVATTQRDFWEILQCNSVTPETTNI